MGDGERLVQVQVADVAAELARLGPAGERVEVRAVDVDLSAGRVHLVAHVADLRVEDTVGGRVGDHDARDVLAVLLDLRVEIGEVDGAVVRGLDHDDAQVCQRCRGCVRTVRRGRDEDNVAAVIAVGDVVAADGEQAGELALGTRVGLQGDLGVAGDLSEPILELVDELTPALRRLRGGVRVDARELRPGDRLHGGGGVELHRARAQRDHRAVERQVLVRELAQVAQHLGLGVDGAEDRVGERRGNALERLGQARTLRRGYLVNAERGGERLHVGRGGGLTEGDGHLVRADGAHEVTLLLQGGLDGGGIDARDGDGVEELRRHHGLASLD